MEKSARKVAARLREQGHIAYFAGGCVRDMVRGLTPKDYDIATDARPEIVQALFPRTYAVGAHFGVVLVRNSLQPKEPLPAPQQPDGAAAKMGKPGYDR